MGSVESATLTKVPDLWWLNSSDSLCKMYNKLFLMTLLMLWDMTLMAGMPRCRHCLLPQEAGSDLWVNLDNGRVLCDVQRTSLAHTWRAEKWVTQPTEIQLVPFTDVEISLLHQAQLARLHYQTLPQPASSFVAHKAWHKKWVSFF